VITHCELWQILSFRFCFVFQLIKEKIYRKFCRDFAGILFKFYVEKEKFKLFND